VQAACRTERAAVAPTRPGERIVAETRTETRKAGLLRACLHTPEERGEGLVDAAQHVLASREVGHAYVARRANLLQLLGLVVVAQADGIQAPRRAAFVQRRVVQPTRFVDLAMQRFTLRRRRVSAVLVRDRK